MSQHVLITGSRGNIGEKLAAHLSPLGYRLTLVDRLGGDGVLAADLSEYGGWADTFDGVDTVVHLAAIAPPSATWAEAQSANIASTFNVVRAARTHGVQSIVFASTNHVMGGYRFLDGPVTTELPPAPLHPYGISKLFGEEMGRNFVKETGRTFIAMRIGYWQRGENIPGPHMASGSWGQQMWLSNRDGVNGMERAIAAKDAGFAIINHVSNNPGMRWEIESARRLIGYVPQDGHATEVNGAVREMDATEREMWKPHPYWLR